MMLSHLLLVACLVAGTWAKLPPVYQNEPLLDLSTSGHSGKPLFLTPYIEKGQIDEAKRLARVGRLRGANVPSYSGYLTVNKTTDSNLFFWFFPALKNPKNAPTVLWLQGGPGGSSLFGLFVEHGPYEITKTHFARFRRTTWAQQFNMLYIDNPVGTGYSFTTSDDGYATNEVDVGRDLFEALQQFFTLFSEYAKNEFYITGESYAGKYVPAVAYTIHQRREKANMNLAGIAIGDGLCDPVTMLDYADFALQVGLIDHAQATSLRALQDKAKTLIAQGDFREAERIFDQINGRIMTVSGLEFYYNFLLAKQPASFAYYNKFVQTPKTRRAVHVGNLTYNDGSMVQTKLADDFMRSVKPWIAELMNNNYKVMIYNGQLDIIIASPLTATFVDSINWTGAKDLSVAQRQIWKNPHTGEPAGYVRQAGNFTQVLVRNAGHILPFDQPENAYDMIDRFINNRSFS